MPPRPKPTDLTDRYWRTFQRKLGEDLDLAGKALTATGAAAMFAPLATKGVITFPTPAVGAILAFGLVFLPIGIHLQAKGEAR